MDETASILHTLHLPLAPARWAYCSPDSGSAAVRSTQAAGALAGTQHQEVPALGLFEMTAADLTGVLDWWGNTNWHSSLKWRAPDATLPTTANLDEGLEHFASSCLMCHGAPDVPRAQWAHEMQPQPPMLWKEDTQEMEDGTLFYVVRGGVRMTGMPAFGADHADADIWNMVAAVRQLEHLTGEQHQKLMDASASYRHNEESEDSAHAPAHEAEQQAHANEPEQRSSPGGGEDGK